MSKHEDAVRLRHMLDAALKATEFVAGKKRTDLDQDEQLTLALVRLLEVLGEAAKQVSEDTRKRYSQIPWAGMMATRNRLIHGYFDVDLDIMWEIVDADLPPLIKDLQSILSSAE